LKKDKFDITIQKFVEEIASMSEKLFSENDIVFVEAALIFEVKD